MKQIRVIVIDDEPIAIEVIKELILQLTPDLVVDSTATNGLDAVQKITLLKPDLVFLDVDMPLMNGFDVLHRFRDRHFAIVFTTGFESDTLKKLKQESVDYLLKPIDPDEFRDAVSRAKEKMEMANKSL